MTAITMRTRMASIASSLTVIVSCLGCSTPEVAVTIPEETALLIALDRTVQSNEIQSGSIVTGTVAKSVLLDGQIVIPAGGRATVEVVQASEADDDDPARLALELQSLTLANREVDVEVERLEIVGEPEGMSDGEKVAAGAVGGALVGGITKGGKGAVVGGVLGSMTGAVIAIQTANDGIVLPAGQTLAFYTTAEIEVPDVRDLESR